MLKKLTIYGAGAAVLAVPSAALASFMPPPFVSERLSPGGMVVFLGGLPVNGIFVSLAVLVTTAFIIFWLLMLVDCLKRRWPGRLLWSAILIASLPVGLYWLSGLLYYLLVMTEEQPVGWRQRLAGRLRYVASRLGRRPRH